MLPIAPRPYVDELFSSWIGRVASTYDMCGGSLVAELFGRTPGIADIHIPSELLHLLAERTRLPVARLEQLDLKHRLPTLPRRWLVYHRWPQWLLEDGRPPTPLPCPEHPDKPITLEVGYCWRCLIEDRAQGRSEHLRVWWGLGCMGFCHRHREPLMDWCWSCRCGLGIRAKCVGGSTRLACGKCGAWLAERANSDRLDADATHNWARTIDLERALLAALVDGMPGPTWLGSPSAATFARWSRS